MRHTLIMISGAPSLSFFLSLILSPSLRLLRCPQVVCEHLFLYLSLFGNSLTGRFSLSLSFVTHQRCGCF